MKRILLTFLFQVIAILSYSQKFRIISFRPVPKPTPTLSPFPSTWQSFKCPPLLSPLSDFSEIPPVRINKNNWNKPNTSLQVSPSHINDRFAEQDRQAAMRAQTDRKIDEMNRKNSHDRLLNALPKPWYFQLFLRLNNADREMFTRWCAIESEVDFYHSLFNNPAEYDRFLYLCYKENLELSTVPNTVIALRPRCVQAHRRMLAIGLLHTAQSIPSGKKFDETDFKKSDENGASAENSANPQSKLVRKQLPPSWSYSVQESDGKICIREKKKTNEAYTAAMQKEDYERYENLSELAKRLEQGSGDFEACVNISSDQMSLSFSGTKNGTVFQLEFTSDYGIIMEISRDLLKLGKDGIFETTLSVSRTVMDAENGSGSDATKLAAQICYPPVASGIEIEVDGKTYLISLTGLIISI